MRCGRIRNGQFATAPARMNRSSSRKPGKPTQRTDGINPVQRRRARVRAMQAIYAWQISGGTIQSLLEQFAHEQIYETADLLYFESLLRGVLTHWRQLDQALTPFIDRPMAEVDAIERAVLRLAAFELRQRPDIPWRVVIDEAVRTTRRFGSEHGHTWINGVLDKAATAWRSNEINPHLTQ